MTVRNKMSQFVFVTAMITLVGCDADTVGVDEVLEDADALELTFRDGECDPLLATCNYRNAFYLGFEEYPLDNIPLTQGSDPDTTVTEITRDGCLDSRGMPMQGTFHVLTPNLSLDEEGTFGATAFQQVGMPNITCMVEGQMWEGTEWYVTTDAKNAEGQIDTIDVRLHIAEMEITPDESTLYIWETDYDYLYGGASGAPWHKVCDLDPDPMLDFEAVHYRYLRISDVSGEFTHDPDTFYVGCTSGLVAKSGYTWGYRSQGNAVHQVISHAGIAAYCGPTEGSHTVNGTSLAVYNATGSGPDQIQYDFENHPIWTPEAAWGADMMPLCIGTTRLPQFQPVAGAGFDCGGGLVIPPCTTQILSSAEVMLVTYAEK